MSDCVQGLACQLAVLIANFGEIVSLNSLHFLQLAMEALPADVAVHMCGYLAIANLAPVLDASSSLDSVTTAVHCLLLAMDAHTSSSRVQGVSCHALMNLAVTLICRCCEEVRICGARYPCS